MAEDGGAEPSTQTGGWPTRRAGRRAVAWRAPLAAVLLVVLATLAALWLGRERIATEVIADALAERGIEATYEVESIEPDSAVLRNIVIGDPARPDLTVARARVHIRHRLGFPDIDEVVLVRPRLYGSYRDGEWSFGALDPLIFTGADEPFELPDLTLIVEDGGAQINTDFGRVGLSVTGEGWLRDGFRAEVGALAPDFSAGGCRAERASLYGTLAIANARPAFSGPLRLSGLACPEGNVALAEGVAQLEVQAGQRLRVFEGRAALALGRASLGSSSLAGAEGELGFTWRDGGLTARYELTASGLTTPQARLASVELDGAVRARRGFERIEVDAAFDGRGLRLGGAVDSALAGAIDAGGGTFVEPILRRVRGDLARTLPGSSVAGQLIARRTDQRWSVVVPEARLRGTDSALLLALSRFQWAGSRGGSAATYAGNLATGGLLPRIVVRAEREAGGAVALRASMAAYSAGAARLAVPEFAARIAPDGALSFTGALAATGPLPGGWAEGLELPLSGRWSDAGLVLWRDCTQVRFDELRYANLTLDGRRLTLCPPRGRPILSTGAGGLRITAGVPSLSLSGQLGETPIALDSGPVGFAWPGTLSAQRLNVALGPADTPARFAVTDLTARLGDEIGGSFAGTDVLLNGVPLDIRNASGEWAYADGRLTISDGAFLLEDRRAEAPRFNPLVAREASLALEDNLITAEALLREPTSDRAVTRVTIAHDLATGTGGADLAVAGLLFDGDLQPTALTPLALGVVANVEGVVTGTGRIDWNATDLTSTGTFSSDDLDFAAAFGPVEGASGTLRFTDLIGLTTAPGQEIAFQSVNPGIAVEGGTVRLQLRGGEVLAIEGGTWPFLGGTLVMRPLDIAFGVEEVRAYVFEITGLEAALFVARMEIPNFAATGTFDGTIPIIFDRSGNGRVEGGVLQSRPPGGSLSYVGELTYEDLSPMANFAFDALRSLEYEQMRIQLDGSLTGEIVTRVRFDGVSQGEGASSNFITRRLARLPLRFDVNIRAPFYSLLGSIRGLYDPEALRDPRELGLIDADGNPIRRSVDGTVPPPPDTVQDIVEQVLDDLIQPSESEEQP